MKRHIPVMNPGSGLPPMFRRTIENAFKRAKAIAIRTTKHATIVTFHRKTKIAAPKMKRVAR